MSKIDDCREAIAIAATKLAEEVINESHQEGVKPKFEAKEKAAILKTCSEVVSNVAFGPQGANTEYNYNQRTWSGYHPPGFIR